jgi:hypothetical protein
LLRTALAAVTMLSLALAPKACTKKQQPSPAESDFVPPPPIPSATTPPIWAPPQGPGTAPVTTGTTAPPVPSVSPELVKARAAADAKDFKKVKTLLEKRARSGKGTPEENQLVFRACVQTKDKACIADVRAKHPEDVADLSDKP